MGLRFCLPRKVITVAGIAKGVRGKQSKSNFSKEIRTLFPSFPCIGQPTLKKGQAPIISSLEKHARFVVFKLSFALIN
jgi:hypothetical protein